MGGCCCCSSRRTESSRTSVYLYYPPASEEREPLSSRHGSASAISSGMLFNTNLETSSPDTYRAPPPPLPYDVGLVGSQIVPQGFAVRESKAETELLRESECLREAENDGFEKECLKAIEDKPSKMNDHIISLEEDTCPICLEEYEPENPQIITKCEHHFHLSCILEWMERSETCPICDQVTVIDQTFTE